MIQTILLFTLRPGVTDEQIEALRAGLAAAGSGSEPGHSPGSCSCSSAHRALQHQRYHRRRVQYPHARGQMPQGTAACGRAG